jgi:hypothetical protein
VAGFCIGLSVFCHFIILYFQLFEMNDRQTKARNYDRNVYRNYILSPLQKFVIVDECGALQQNHTLDAFLSADEFHHFVIS